MVIAVMLGQPALAMGFVHYIFWIPIAVILYCALVDNIREWLEKRKPDEE